MWKINYFKNCKFEEKIEIVKIALNNFYNELEIDKKL
jgi:hypothetical protein